MSTGSRTKKNKKKRGESGLDLVIDISGVGPERRVGDLTVEEFVQLLVQVSAQLRSQARTRAQDPRFIASVTRRIQGELKAKPLGTKDVVGKRVLDSQLAILQRIPEVMKKAYSSTRRGQSK